MTLGNYERKSLERIERTLKVRTWTDTVSALAMPFAVVGAAGALGVALVGFGLNDDLNKEAIRNILIGVPEVKRTRRDGTEQVIENPAFGVPIIGPLFGTGLRIGEKTAEATTRAVDAALTAVEETTAAAFSETGVPTPGELADEVKQTAEEVQAASTDLVGRWAQFMGRLYGYR